MARLPGTVLSVVFLTGVRCRPRFIRRGLCKRSSFVAKIKAQVTRGTRIRLTLHRG